MTDETDPRDVAREEVERGFESIGLNVTTVDGRREASELVYFMRQRKKSMEANTTQFRNSAIGAAVAAALSFFAAWSQFGGHK